MEVHKNPLKTDQTGVPLSPKGQAATPVQIKEKLDEIQEYHYQDSLIKQQIISTLTDETYL